MKLIIGLGNPGDKRSLRSGDLKYAGTRHNLGFEILDEVAKKFNLEDWTREEKFKSELIKTPELILAKPQTYMNNSGMAVKLLANYYKIAPEDIIIIHDELDLPLGKIKVRKGGAAAGHHGVESVIAFLGTDQFIRVRLGIGPAVGVVEKFVLELFTSKEKPPIKHMIKQVIKAIDLLLEKGLEKAQNQYN